MTAEAREQSVLEAKDKEPLLAIAKALGLKRTTRTRKADIIGSILATTSYPERTSPVLRGKWVLENLLAALHGAL